MRADGGRDEENLSVNSAPCGKGKQQRQQGGGGGTDGQMGDEEEEEEERGVMCADPSGCVCDDTHTLQARSSGSQAAGGKRARLGYRLPAAERQDTRVVQDTHTHTHRAASAPPGDGGVRGHPYITRAALTCRSGTKAHAEIGHRLENMLIHPPNAVSKHEKEAQGGSRLACLGFSDGKQVKLQLSLTGPVWRCTSLFIPVRYRH